MSIRQVKGEWLARKISLHSVFRERKTFSFWATQKSGMCIFRIRHWLDRTYFVGLCCKSMFGKTELFAGKFKSGVAMKMEYYLRGWGEQTSEHIWDSVANRGPKKLSSCLNQGVIPGRAAGGAHVLPMFWMIRKDTVIFRVYDMVSPKVTLKG